MSPRRFPRAAQAHSQGPHEKWLPQIEKMNRDGRTHMIVVGAATSLGPIDYRDAARQGRESRRSIGGGFHRLKQAADLGRVGCLTTPFSVRARLRAGGVMSKAGLATVTPSGPSASP